ncbi:MAG: glycosyltransferase family 39 protein [Candidatus Woesearchaeota archaeon]
MNYFKIKFIKGFNDLIIFFKNNLILFFLLIIGFFLRLFKINEISYWVDEAISINQVMQPFLTNIFLVASDVHPPLYNILLWFWTRLFGFNEISTKFMSLIFSVLSILLIYLIAKKLFSKNVAIFSATLLTFSKINIYYAQETRMYSLLLFLSLLSMYYYISLFLTDNKRKQDKKFFVGFSFKYIISSVLLIYTHIFSLFILFIQGLFIVLYHKKKLFCFFKNNFIIFLLYLPWIPVIINQFLKVTDSYWLSKPNFLSLYETIVDFSGSIFLFYLFTFIISMFFFYSLIKKYFNYKILFVFCWFILPILILFLISVLFKPFFLTRYILYCSLPYFILIAYSINKLVKFKIIKCLIIIIIIFFSILSIFEYYNNNSKEDWNEVVFFIKNNYNHEKIIIHPHYEIFPFLYYFDRNCFSNKIGYDFKKDISYSNCNKNIFGVNQIYDINVLLNESFWLIKYYEDYYKINDSYYILEDLNKTHNVFLLKKIKNIAIYKGNLKN